MFMMSYKKETCSRPIMLFGFARSGTTTSQRILSDAFHYNACMEPIGFNHSNYNEKDFSRCAVFFRGAPNINDLSLYQMGGAPVSALHAISDRAIQETGFSALDNYIKHLFNYYGSNVVIKELRLIPNLISIEKICDSINISPVYIFLMCNPLMPLYTYYRLGGLIENNDFSELRVNEIYEYRKITYLSLGLFEEFMKIECRNKFDKLVLSVFLDQMYMKYYANLNPDNCLVVDFANINTSVKEISEKFAIPIKEEMKIFPKNTSRYEGDYFFMKYVKRKINPALISLIEEHFSCPSSQTTSVSLNYRVWVSFFRQKLCAAFFDTRA